MDVLPSAQHRANQDREGHGKRTCDDQSDEGIIFVNAKCFRFAVANTMHDCFSQNSSSTLMPDQKRYVCYQALSTSYIEQEEYQYINRHPLPVLVRSMISMAFPDDE